MLVAPTAPVRTRARVATPPLTTVAIAVPEARLVRAEFGTVSTSLTVARVIVAVAVEPLAMAGVGSATRTTTG